MRFAAPRNALGHMIEAPVEVRIRQRIIKMPNGCHEWQGACAGKGDYPVLRVNGRQTRVSHLVLKKPRPTPKHVACHRCDNVKCVRRGHLFWGTNKENTQDMLRKGRARKPALYYLGEACV